MANDAYLIVDIGTSKIISVVASKNVNGDINIHGAGERVSEGIEKGIVLDAKKATAALKGSIVNAINTSLHPVKKVFVSVSAIQSAVENATGKVQVVSGIVAEHNINQVLKMAVDKLYNSPNKRLIHLLPKGFIVDDEDDSITHNPINIRCSMLSCEAIGVFVKPTVLKNIKAIFNNIGHKIDGYILSPYATSFSVLTKEQKDAGVLLIDIGGSISEFCIFNNNILTDCGGISVGGENIIYDLHKVLQTPIEAAIEIRQKYGSLFPNEKIKNVKIPIIGNEQKTKEVLLSTIRTHIHARVEEILSLIRDELIRKQISFSDFSSIVLTGGTSNILGIDKLASKVFDDKPATIAELNFVKNSYAMLNDNRYSTINGMIYYLLDENISYEFDSNMQLKQPYIVKKKEQELIQQEHPIKEIYEEDVAIDKVEQDEHLDTKHIEHSGGLLYKIRKFFGV